MEANGRDEISSHWICLLFLSGLFESALTEPGSEFGDCVFIQVLEEIHVMHIWRDRNNVVSERKRNTIVKQGVPQG
jgi:hypothetical protein